MLIKDTWGDKIKFTHLHTYKELVFTFLLFLTDAFFCACVCICVRFNTIQCDTIELETQCMNSLQSSFFSHYDTVTIVLFY